MTSKAINTTNSANLPNPVAQLQDIFIQDMKTVNAHILENMQSDVALIPQLASYLIAAGGKRIRPLLTLAATSLSGGDMERATRLAAAVEFIHTATLLHDDVVDDSDKRRGQDSAKAVFGNEASVLVGDFLFSRAFQLMVKDGSLDVLRILSNASAVIAEGEVQQLSLQSNLETDMDAYLSMIDGKTAALFAAACEVGPVIASGDGKQQNALRDYGQAIGIAFQITDDMLDYDSARSELGKEAGDDFREGKMTAPVIFAIQHADAVEKEFWQRTLAEKEQSEGDFDMAVSYINKHDAMTCSLDLAKSYENKAHKALEVFDDGDVKDILKNLATYITSRNF